MSSILPVPVGEHHHDVERRQEEGHVEEWIAVRHLGALVIAHLLSAELHVLVKKNTGHVLKYGTP